MTPRLEVLWHREIGGRLLVALEEEPVVQCQNHSYDKIHYHKQRHADGPYPSIPMPSGTRVELVQKCDYCVEGIVYSFSGGEAVEDPVIEDGCPRCTDGFTSLGVATLEEVVPWEKLMVALGPMQRAEPPFTTSVGTIVVSREQFDELTPLSPKYVALCEV